VQELGIERVGKMLSDYFFYSQIGTEIIIRFVSVYMQLYYHSLERLIKLVIPLHNAGAVFDVVCEIASRRVHDIFYYASASFLG
jgi:hypothetical protein